MSSPALPPMGWYADPAGSSQERYWDGAKWTPNLRDTESNPATRSAPASRSTPATREAGRGHDPASSDSQGNRGVAEPMTPAPATGRQAALTADGVPLAGWWWRVLATLIDQVVIGALVVVPAWGWIQQVRGVLSRVVNDAMVAASNGTTPPSSSTYTAELNAPMLYLQLTIIGVGAAYLLLSYLAFGRTLGNRATGTWVVRLDRGSQRGRLSPLLAVGRTAAISSILLMNQILPVLWLIDVLAALVTKRRQTLHDLMAGTQVVRPASSRWRG